MRKIMLVAGAAATVISPAAAMASTHHARPSKDKKRHLLSVKQNPRQCGPRGGWLFNVSAKPYHVYACKGTPGAVGRQGLAGVPGLQGVQGLQGIPGLQGAQGPQGIPGINGVNGMNGKDGAVGPQGPTGATGPQGAQGRPGSRGDSYLTGAYYSVASYDVGDTNGGAIATVACNSPSDTAISGGVSTTNGANVPVGQSFPGRMDWTTNTPKPNRLDGWIVQFASETGSAPMKAQVWALCVPGLQIPVNQTFTESTNG